MADVPEADSTRERRRRTVLAAAAKRLGSVAFDWRKGLTFDLLVADTGFDRKIISSDFGNKDQLVADLVDYCLNPDNFAEFGEPWAEDLAQETMERLLDPEVDLFDSLMDVGRLDFEYVRHDARLRSQLAIWALALDDERARAALHRMYEFYDEQHRQVWTGFVQALDARGIRARGGLTIDETVTSLTALVEGLAIRWHVDPDNVPVELFGQVFATLACGLFVIDGETATVPQRLAELDVARRKN